MTDDELQPDDLEEGMRACVEWSPRSGRAPGNSAEGDVTRVWRPDDVEEFTIRVDDFAFNVYTDYRTPVVERVEVGEDEDEEPERETVGRLDRITSVDE